MKQFIIDFVKSVDRDDVFGTAARTSFFVLLSLFPLILFVVGVLGWFGIYQDPAVMEHILPGQLTDMLDLTADAVPRAGHAAVSLAAMLWSASRGIWALMRGVHTAYGGGRLKSSVGAQARALALTLGFALSLAATAGLWLITSDWWAADFPESGPLGGALSFAGSAAAVVLFVAMLYRFTPRGRTVNNEQLTTNNGQRGRLRCFLPGVCLAAGVWLIVNRAFGAFADYIYAGNPLYGGASAFLAVALWIYAVSAGVIAGAELNAVCLSRCSPSQAGCGGAPPPD